MNKKLIFQIKISNFSMDKKNFRQEKKYNYRY